MVQDENIDVDPDKDLVSWFALAQMEGVASCRAFCGSVSLSKVCCSSDVESVALASTTYRDIREYLTGSHGIAA